MNADVRVPVGRVGVVAAASIVLCFVALTAFVYGPFFPGAFSSDAAVHVVLARHLMKLGVLLSPQWFYPNSDLVVTGPFMLGMVMIKIMGFGVPALWWTAGLTFLALFVCLVLSLRALGFSPWAATVGSCAALACTSNSHVEFLCIQAGYPYITVLYIAAFTLYTKLQQTSEIHLAAAGRKLRMALLLLVVLTLALANPSRTLAFVVAPILMVELTPWHKPWRIRPSRLTIALIASLVAGYVIYQILLRQGLHFSLPSGFRSATFDLNRTKHQFLQVLRFIFVVHPGFNHRIVGGALSALVLVLGALQLRSGQLSPSASTLMKLMLWQMAAVLAGGLIGGIFIDPSAVRYFLPALVVLMAIAAAASVDALGQQDGQGLLAASFLAAMALATGHAVATLGTLESTARESGPVQTPHVLLPVTEEIRKRGLTHGFVEWDANVMNVLGKGSVEFCQITYRDQLIPFKWNVPLWCYDPARLPDRFFLVIKPQNRDAARLAAKRTLVHPPVETFSVGGYEVQVYRTADVDTSWLHYPVPDGPDLKTPWTAPAANPQMFSYVVEPSKDKTFEFTGRAGETVYGPYINLNRGHYRLTWFGQLASPDANAVQFLVTDSGGRHLLAETHGSAETRTSSGLAPIAALEFKVRVPVPEVNFVVEQKGHAHMVLNSYRLERLDSPPHP